MKRMRAVVIVAISVGVVVVAVVKVRQELAEGKAVSLSSSMATMRPPSQRRQEPAAGKAVSLAGGAAGEAGMTAIAPGSFLMGSDPGADGEDDEKPVTRREVGGFLMDTNLVTVGEYRACVQAGSCAASATVNRDGLSAIDQAKESGLCNWGKSDRDGHPINCVDFAGAKGYCEWKGKRLPSEEEWEFGARGSDGRRYPWGNEAPSSQLCWDGEGSEAGQGNRTSTCVVGSHPGGKSPSGLMDMAGNVYEWTNSSYCPYDKADCGEARRAVRGGSWDDDDPSWVRAAFRLRIPPSDRGLDLGFRCARTAP